MQLVLNYGIDILLILVLAFSIIFSVHKGFLKCVLSLICAVVALVAASTFNETASEWCYDNILSNIVVSNIEEKIEQDYGIESVESSVQAAVESLPEFITLSLDKLGIDINDVTDEINQVQLSSEDTAEVIAENIIRPGALVLLKVILFLIIFLAVRFLLGIISEIICKIADLPILKQVNKTLGAVSGAIKGITLVFAFSIFFNFLSELLKNTNVFAQAIENSHICDIIIELIK